MSGFRFRLAGPEDDAALRNLLRRTPMPGPIALAFLREGGFEAAERIGSGACQTMLCCDAETGEVVGLGSRSLRQVYVDGRPAPVGYLSLLRGLPQARSGTGLARGYRFLRELHADGRARFYFTTILDENAEGARLLTSGRAGLPTYEPLAQLRTGLLPLRRRRFEPREKFPVERATIETLPAAFECLDAWNRTRQLAPVYTLADLSGETGLLSGFQGQDLYIARQGGRVVATLGVWDQLRLKQTVVAGFSPGLAAARPVYNALAWLAGRPGLPAVGQPVRTLHAAFLSAAVGSEAAFAALLRRAARDWSGRGYDYLAAGYTAGSELERWIRPLACREIRSTLYAVYWPEDGVPAFDRTAPFHVEVATL